MEVFLFGLGALVALLLAGFVAYLLLKGLWKALISVKNNGPDFIGKVFVSFGASVVAGVIGAVLLGVDLTLAGGVGLVGAVGAAVFTRST